MLRTKYYRQDIKRLLDENKWGAGTRLTPCKGELADGEKPFQIRITDVKNHGDEKFPLHIIYADWPIGSGRIQACSLTCREWEQVA